MEYPICLILRIAVALAFLGYASVRDIKGREVPDKVWVLSIPVCLIFTVLDVYAGNVVLSDVVISLTLALALGFLLFYIGFYGGADSKGLLLIAAAAPSFLYERGSFVRIVFPMPILFIFFCAIVLSALYPLMILTLNLVDLSRGLDPLRGVVEENPLKRLLLLATARRVSFIELKESGLRYLPSEKAIEKDGRLERKPLYSFRIKGDAEKFTEELEKQGNLYADGILASPTIPMVLFLTLGFALSTLLIYA
jgi:Flp pilus assembly protein protease CpaA